MKITDTQVVAQLKLRRAKLKVELERVEIAIRAFQEVDEKNMDYLEAAPYLVEEIITADNDEMAQAILLYNPRDSYNRKIKYALSKIGEGSATHITQYLLQIDRKIKEVNNFHQRITYSASRMYKQGEIAARQDGRINIYKLKTLPVT